MSESAVNAGPASREQERPPQALARASRWRCCLVVLFFVVTIVKLGGNVLNRPL